MKTYLTFGAVSAAALLAASTAQAAPADWSGFYIGGAVGWVSADSDGANSVPCSAACPYFLQANADAINAAGGFGLSDSTFTGAGTLGFNFQAGSFVFGVEGDFGVLNIADGQTDDIRYATAAANGNYFGNSIDTDWLATARARLGLDIGSGVMVFATGGAAFSDVTLVSTTAEHVGGAISPACGLCSVPSGSTYSNTRTGWTVGGGLEWMAHANWSFKAEYLWVDLGDFGSTTLYNGTGQTVDHAADLTAHVARIGLNFHF